MKTVLVFSANIEKWGAERSTCSLCGHLVKSGYNVLVIIPRSGSIIELFEENGLNYLILPFGSWTDTIGDPRRFLFRLRSVKYNFRQILQLKSLLKEKNISPILVYSNTLTFGFGILTSFLYKTPHIQHIRENVDVFGLRFKWGFRFSLWMINRFSDRVICTCNAIKERYEKYIDSKKILPIYNGIPISEFSKSSNNTDTIFKIVFVGRLMEDKRPMDLLRAVEKMVTNGMTNFLVDFYGEGDQQATIEDFIVVNHLQKYVNLLGYQSNIDLTSYDVGIMSSTFEAFARVTLEFMMSGLAVVGSNSGGTIEQVVAGETGLLYKPHDVENLFLCLKELYLDRKKCAQYGLNGRLRVEKHFSQDSYVNGVVEQFKLVLSR
jgi:glycosyltransferase involved in cell wall biosynthesis